MWRRPAQRDSFLSHFVRKWATKLWGRAAQKERCKVLYSGTFGRGLIAFVQSLAVLVEDIRILVESDLYQQRLTRHLRHPDNVKAHADFLTLDNFFRDHLGLMSKEDADALFEIRKQTFEKVRESLPFRSFSRDYDRWRDLLHLNYPRRSPEEVLKQIG